jgi:two-component system response regulator (stage 0 sporulation protein F)
VVSAEPGRAKILIVDDADEVVALCVGILRTLGYAVSGASGGQAALDLIRTEAFDLVIIDYKMPEMSGFEVFEAARGLRPDMAFMLLTGHSSSDVIEDATDLGFDTTLTKPFTRQQLRLAVERTLQGRK